MEMLITMGFVLFAAMAVFGTIDMIRQINKLSDKKTKE
jgi:hypothetical protein